MPVPAAFARGALEGPSAHGDIINGGDDEGLDGDDDDGADVDGDSDNIDDC